MTTDPLTQELARIDAVLDGLSSPTTAEAYEALRQFNGTAVRAALASRAVGGGVGGVGGALQWTDVTTSPYNATGTGLADDTAAIQAALDACAASTYGGVVYLPPGRYTITDELTWGLKTHILGAGIYATQLHWPNDLGAGKFAMKASTTNQSQPQWHYVHNIGFTGAGSSVVGTDTWGMSGYQCPSRTAMNRVYISGFHRGAVVDNDHEQFIDCTFTSNTYNVDFAYSNPGNGNQYFLNCSLTGASKASVHVDGHNTIGGCTFLGCHVGLAPYGFLRTDPAVGSTDNTFMFDTVLASCVFEEIGNGAIVDLSTGATDCLKSVQILNPGFAWSDSDQFYWDGQSYDWCIYLPGAVAGVDVWQGAYPFKTATTGGGRPGPGVGTVYIGNPGAPAGFVLHGNQDGPHSSFVQYHEGTTNGMWMIATGTINAGELLEWAGGDHVARYGTSTNAFAGFAGSSATNGQPVFLGRGLFQLPIFEACTFSAGDVISPDPTVKYHANTGGTPVIGYAGNGGSPTAGQTAKIWAKY